MANPAQPKSARSTIKRNARRAVYEEEVIRDILDAGTICHVAYVDSGEPRLIPTLYACRGEFLYLHGNRMSALLKHISNGGEICLSVMLVDGVVVARSGFHCSMNYRSVSLFGKGEAVTGDEHRTVLDYFVAALIPGHEKAVREPTAQELSATAVVRIRIDEMAAKVRAGDPIDDDADLDGDTWAGVIPLEQVASGPIPAQDLKSGIDVPDYIRSYRPASGSSFDTGEAL